MSTTNATAVTTTETTVPPKEHLMTRARTLWFLIAALCVALAVGIFAGRTPLSSMVSGDAYRVLIIAAYLSLAGAAGSLTKAFTLTHNHSPSDPQTSPDRTPSSRPQGTSTQSS